MRKMKVDESFDEFLEAMLKEEAELKQQIKSGQVAEPGLVVSREKNTVATTAIIPNQDTSGRTQYQAKVTVEPKKTEYEPQQLGYFRSGGVSNI